MGSALGTRFEELRAILDAVPDVPVGVCMDTAHAFAAGYDIHTEAGLSQTIDGARSHRGAGSRGRRCMSTIRRRHFGSRVDRHEHIGKGQIGLEAFRRILTHPRLSASAPDGRPGRAFILETPIDAPGDDRRNVRALWELAGFDVKQAPDARERLQHAARRSANAPRLQSPSRQRTRRRKLSRRANRSTLGKQRPTCRRDEARKPGKTHQSRNPGKRKG